MYCDLIQKLLRQSRGQAEALPPFGWEHLQACDNCAAYAEDVEFDHLLRKLPVLPASEGFTDRALQQAWLQRENSVDSRGSKQVKATALAASLILATSVALFSLLSDKQAVPGLLSQQAEYSMPMPVTQIELLMVSATDLPEAMITLRMDENVSLDGYANYRELSWPTDLTAGNNQLTLPVQLLNNHSGDITVHVESNGAASELQFTVDPNRPHAAAMFLI
jgi:hypothetical protein